ncbi:MAG: hypothetical protein ABWX70_13455 [Hyphomicrobium sp.]
MLTVSGRATAIIGATGGMELTAKILLEGGARVLVTGRSKSGLDAAQHELGRDAIVIGRRATLGGH